MSTVTLSLVSHTNAGKTTLARTLLRQDIGEVRDAPHVTEFETAYELIASDEGDLLRLWDTPGFSDATRLLRRMRLDGHALGWLLSEVWDRWRERAFWSSQRALRHVQAESDVVLYLVNAAESPAAAAYVEAEMELLAWVGKPILVLLNQLGAPRDAAAEAADVAAWRAHLQRWPLARVVLPLDAFARCWVHERRWLLTVQGLLEGEAAAAMGRLTRAWCARGESVFAAAMQALAAGLARVALERETIDGDARWVDRIRRVGAAVARREDAGPVGLAQQRLAAALEAETARTLARLIALYGLQGRAQAEIARRVEGQFALHQRVSEGRSAVVGGAVSGAALGLKADIASGGLTLGGGVLLGALLGALGGAGIARGINLVRGTDSSWVAWSDEALDAAVQAALLRYLAVAHFGRGRGDWVAGEAPAHWAPLLAAVWDMRAPGRSQAFVPERASAQGRAVRAPDGEAVPEEAALAAALAPLLEAAVLAVLERLYPADEPLPARTASEEARAPTTASS